MLPDGMLLCWQTCVMIAATEAAWQEWLRWLGHSVPGACDSTQGLLQNVCYAVFEHQLGLTRTGASGKGGV